MCFIGFSIYQNYIILKQKCSSDFVVLASCIITITLIYRDPSEFRFTFCAIFLDNVVRKVFRFAHITKNILRIGKVNYEIQFKKDILRFLTKKYFITYDFLQKFWQKIFYENGDLFLMKTEALVITGYYSIKRQINHRPGAQGLRMCWKHL